MDFLFDGPEQARTTFLFAHGAGAAMDSGFMDFVAQALAVRGVRVVRFEFPYMAARRTAGARRPPDSQARLLQTWRDAVHAIRPGARRLAIGGKSMGGRMASMVADELEVAALVCMGYPFHPPGKPDQLRTEHLRALRTRTLVVQGTRDAFGTQPEVTRYPLSSAIRFHWVEGGDHSWKPPRGSGRTEQGNREEAVAAIADFLA